LSSKFSGLATDVFSLFDGKGTTQLHQQESLSLCLACQTVKFVESKGEETEIRNSVKYEDVCNHFLTLCKFYGVWRLFYFPLFKTEPVSQ